MRSGNEGDQTEVDGMTEVGSEIMLPLRTVDVVAYALARERAARQTFKEKRNQFVNWEHMWIYSTHSSCGVLENC